MSVYDYSNEAKREEAIDAAVTSVRDGRLIVLPTDTVYGIGADAFNADAVNALLAAKGRGRNVPPPVLVGDPNVVHALGVDVPDIVDDLIEEYWPGALTVIVQAQPSLSWDLGETAGTVALRMPSHEAALELLKKTGPLAVSSANKHGRDAAKNVMDAAVQLGDAVQVYIDGGDCAIGEPSTIIDTTVEPLAILRHGAISEETITERFGPIFSAKEEETGEPESEAPASDTPASDPQAADTPATDTRATGERSAVDDVQDAPRAESPSAGGSVAVEGPTPAEDNASAASSREEGPTA